MHISLPPELEKFIHDKIADGAYESENELITDALRQLADKDKIPPERLVQLNKDIEEGLDDLVILEGHSAMQMFIKKINNLEFGITSKAYSDIETITDYIAEDTNKFMAYKMLRIFYKTFFKLMKNPDLGQERKDYTKYDVRFFVVKKTNLIIYKVIENKKLHILRILTTYPDICKAL